MLTVDSILSLIGFLFLTYLSIHLGACIYLYLFRRFDLSVYHAAADASSWAVITGATDGIGRAFAEVLLEAGFSVLIVGRNEEKLRAVQKYLGRSVSAGCSVRIVVSEASDTSPANIERVLAALPADAPVTILINNVGMAVQMDQLARQDPGKLAACITVNCTYGVVLTQALLPRLLTSPRCLVLNVSSMGGFFASPYLHVYSATKAFNRVFSEGLAMEAAVHHPGLDVLCVSPGFVATRMSKMRPSATCVTARSCAEASLHKIGWTHAIPNGVHALVAAGLALLWIAPIKVRSLIIAKNFETSIRKLARARQGTLADGQEEKVQQTSLLHDE